MRAVPLFLFFFFLQSAATPIDIGSRRELFVDDYLIEETTGTVNLQLHRPVPQEIALIHDEPWEGTGCGYYSIFKDGELFRMYYKAMHIEVSDGELNTEAHPRFTCYAESDDGIHWRKPALNLHEYLGSKANNITITSDQLGELEIDAAHPAIFKDPNPKAPADAQYKAVLRSRGLNGLCVLKSADGLSWSPFIETPILRLKGAFDSQNLAFWDPTIERYRAYWRTSPEGVINDTEWKPKGNRAVRTGQSDNLEDWDQVEDLSYGSSPSQQMYTNGVQSYHRAPHILFGFPMRYIERENRGPMQSLPDPENRELRASSNPRYGHALSESLLMTSRDGVHFKRWDTAFLRPGPERPGTWHYGAHNLAWGIVETRSDLPGAANELSIYASEDYWHGKGSAVRRYTLRLDGFVSASANWNGGTLLTKPLTFDGDQLELNFATSAAGHIRIQLQDIEGNPLPGFTFADCPYYFGDSVSKHVSWINAPDLGSLAGKTIRLNIELKDADIFSFRFF